jgi:hypothetical protein
MAAAAVRHRRVIMLAGDDPIKLLNNSAIKRGRADEDASPACARRASMATFPAPKS